LDFAGYIFKNANKIIAKSKLTFVDTQFLIVLTYPILGNGLGEV